MNEKIYFYIYESPLGSGNYGNPQGNPFPGAVKLPYSLLSDYLDSMGFVTLTLDGDTVTAVERNEEAYNAYKEANPEVPEKEEPTQLDRIEAQAMYTAMMTNTMLEE